jgi:DNA-directed RNA polymerase specialized sigma24 family protein
MVTEHEYEALDLLAHCRASVQRVQQRNDWQLLDVEEFVHRVIACVRRGDFSDPWKAALNVYCHCLHGACRGDEGPQRQERAFLELQRYLYKLSCRETAGIPAELRKEQINETLLRIWQRLALYRKPGAFLAIAGLELRNVMRTGRVRRLPREQRPWELPPTSIEAAHEEPTVPQAEDPLALMLDNELSHQVQACFSEALRRHPRARQQIEAVWLKYIAGVDDEAISRYFAKPVASVHVMRSRGLRCLRAQPSWQQLAGELGL